MRKRPLCLVVLLIVLWILIIDMVGGAKAPPPNPYEGRYIKVQGQVYRQDAKQIYLKNISIISENQASDFKSNILVYTTEESTYQIGNIIIAEGKLRFPKEPSNLGQFNQKAYYQVQNIEGMISQAKTALQQETVAIIGQRLHELKNYFSRGLEVAEEETASVLKAMLLGEMSAMDEEVKAVYSAGGISHILSISGLHISVIGMTIYQLIRRCVGGFSVPAFISSMLMIGYVSMTGSAVSARRAVIMFVLYLGAQVLGRTYDMLTGLAVAALLILLQEPRYLYQASFQLSFLAMLGISVCYPLVREMWLGTAKNLILEGVISGLCIQIVTLPCLLYWFGEFAPLGLLVNLLILPFNGYLMFSGLVAGGLGVALPSLGKLVVGGAYYILKLCEYLSRQAEVLSGNMGIWGRPSWIQIMLYYILLVLILAIIWWGKRIRMGSMIAVGVMLGLLWFRPQAGLVMTFLDVGQGDSIFWQTPTGNTYLCDGGSSSVSRVGTYRLNPFLKISGVRRIEYLFVTHMDTDHISGIKELLQMDIKEVEIRHLVLPDIMTEDEVYRDLENLAKNKRIPIIYMKAGDFLIDGEVQIECLWPQAKALVSEQNRNEQSLVLRLSYKNFQVLLTGDLEAEGEERFIRSQSLSAVSVLKAGHHGSNGATSNDLLEVLKPKVTILSYGENNTYGHPHVELLERLENIGGMRYETAKGGAITIRTDGENLKITEYKARYF